MPEDCLHGKVSAQAAQQRAVFLISNAAAAAILDFEKMAYRYESDWPLYLAIQKFVTHSGPPTKEECLVTHQMLWRSCLQL